MPGRWFGSAASFDSPAVAARAPQPHPSFRVPRWACSGQNRHPLPIRRIAIDRRRPPSPSSANPRLRVSAMPSRWTKHKAAIDHRGKRINKRCGCRITAAPSVCYAREDSDGSRESIVSSMHRGTRSRVGNRHACSRCCVHLEPTLVRTSHSGFVLSDALLWLSQTAVSAARWCARNAVRTARWPAAS